MSTPQRIQGSATVPDLERQINIAFTRIQPQIDAASGTGGVSTAEFEALSAQVANLTNVSGSDLDAGGTGNPAPTPASTTVTTDGSTITGDGGQSPITLVVPVALISGGTGIEQNSVQQIITTGNPILAGHYEEQPSLSLAGVTNFSAIAWSLPDTPDPTWLTGIQVIVVCTTSTVTIYLVNPTASTITPIAQLINIKVIE